MACEGAAVSAPPPAGGRARVCRMCTNYTRAVSYSRSHPWTCCHPFPASTQPLAWHHDCG